MDQHKFYFASFLSRFWGMSINYWDAKSITKFLSEEFIASLINCWFLQIFHIIKFTTFWKRCNNFSSSSVTKILNFLFLVCGCFSIFPLKLSITSRENTGSWTHFIYWSTNSIKSLRFSSHSFLLQILYALFCIVQLGNQHTYNRWVDIIRNMFSYYSFTFEKDVVEQPESFCITKF